MTRPLKFWASESKALRGAPLAVTSSFKWRDSTGFQKDRTGHYSGPEVSPALASREMLHIPYHLVIRELHRNPRLTQRILYHNLSPPSKSKARI